MRLSNFLPFRAKSPSLDNRSTQNSCKAWTDVIRKWASHRGESFSPPVDVFETDKDLCIVADLPGLKAGDLEISLSEGTLLLKGKRQKERRPDWTFFRRERPCGSFQRTILLPDRKLDADAMDVKLDKGILKVKIPKKNSSEVVPQFAFAGGYDQFLRSEQIALVKLNGRLALS
jgi:HSP20 family protein